MDEQDILKSLAGFEEVWKRVTAAGPTAEEKAPKEAPSGPSSEEETLKRLIEDEIRDAAYYTFASRMFQGKARTMLLYHAADEKRHARRLQAEYFIRTGESYAPSCVCEPTADRMTSLRAALLREQAGAAAYQSAAERTAAPELREVYLHNAADEQRHAREDRELILEKF